MPSILIVLISIIYFVYHFLTMRAINTWSLLLIVVGFLFSAIYVIAWMPFADSSLILTTFVTFVPLFLLVGIVRDAVPKLEKKCQAKIFDLTINYSIIALLVECYFRISKPFYSLSPGVNVSILEEQLKSINFETFFTDGFYVYKSSSIMFFDSNYVGIFALLILVFLFFAKSNIETERKRYNLKILVVIALVLLSFSRASIATLILLIAVEAFFFFKLKSTRLFYIYISSMTILVMTVLSFLSDYILNDPSFHTKLDIFRSLEKAADMTVSRLIFGFGFNGGAFVYSYLPGAYAHAAIPLILGVAGLSGLVLIYGVMAFYTLKLGRSGLGLMIIIMINGFSILDPWQLMIYWGFAYMYSMNVGSFPPKTRIARNPTELKSANHIFA